VFTSEPCGISLHECASFLAHLDALGLDCEVSASSAWYPGSTMLVMITKGGADASQPLSNAKEH
jgi:hypothetical protein